MRKKFVPYIVTFVLLIIILVFFITGYRDLINYSELTNRHNKVLSGFQNLSVQINNAAVLNPELAKVSNDTDTQELFYTDSTLLLQQLEFLEATVKDSINIQIMDKLNRLVKQELSWLIKSNVPDSIIHYKAPQHIAALKDISTLITRGIQRTSQLIELREGQQNDEIKKLRLIILLFVIVSGTELIFTTISFFSQQSKTKKKEKELEMVMNRISDGVVSVDTNWRYTFLNDAAMATHPLGKEQTLNKIIWDIHPEMKGTVFWDKYHEAMATKKVVEIENYYPPMDTWFSVKVYPSEDGLTIFYKNITENKKLQQQQVLFASIVNSSDDAILSKTLEGIITSWNHGAEKIFGYGSSEIVGKHISILIPPALINEEYEITGKIKNGETIDHYETTRIRKDGKKINVSLTISPIKDDSGNIIGASKISRDVTKEKEAEEKLATSEMRFRSLIENSAEGISLADANSNNIYSSPAAKKIMGELPINNAISRTHPDDLEAIKKVWVEILENPGKPIPYQGRFLHADGHYIWLEVILTNLLLIKGVNAIVTNFRDITKRKQTEDNLIKSEKIYKTIASSIPGSVICLLDPDYRYLLIEGDMLENLGYAKNEMLGNKAADILDPEVFARAEPRFKNVLSGGSDTIEYTINGYDIVSRYVPLKDDKDNVYAIMTVAIDVTKLKDAQRNIVELNRGLEEKIIQRTAQLQAVNKELESFTYSVSHDLRAPLRIIDGFGQILLEDYINKLDEDGQQHIEVIVKNARKMGRLIDDLLNFSKSGKAEMRMADVNMNELVGEATQLLTASGIRIPAQFIVHPLTKAKGDNNLLRQVWENLVSNAIKYSGTQKDPAIEIGMLADQALPTYYIKDNGAGFDMKYADKLFGVFQRLHKAEEFSGTGVGLALVQRIIFRHGGSIWAEARQNEGATFYFTLS